MHKESSVSGEGDRVRASWSFVLVSVLHKEQMILQIVKLIVEDLWNVEISYLDSLGNPKAILVYTVAEM